MQTNCPNCSNRLVVDDAKVPPTPFMLKCPKCQGMVKLPGRGSPRGQTAAQPQAPPPASAPRPAPMAPPPPAPAARPAAAAPAPAAAPTQAMSMAPVPPPANPIGRALVALASAQQATGFSNGLSRLGFAAEVLDAGEEKILSLQQGDYAVVAASPNGVPEDRNVYRMVQSLPGDIRRRVFLVLVGDDLHTGESTQAFALLADLVLNTKDAPRAERLLAQTLHERKRLFQTFWDAEDRKAEGKL